MYMLTEDSTGENVCPENQGNIPLGGPNPPGGEQTHLLEGGETGGGGPPLANDPTGTGDVVLDPIAPGVVQQNEQTKGAQQLNQVNGTPSDTNQENVNVHGAHDNEADIATIQTNNRQHFKTGLNQDEELEGGGYLAEGENKDEDIAGYNYKEDNGVDCNLFCGPPCNFYNPPTGYIPILSSQQRHSVNFVGVSSISTNTNDCVINKIFLMVLVLLDYATGLILQERMKGQ